LILPQIRYKGTEIFIDENRDKGDKGDKRDKGEKSSMPNTQ
jgi:hypothetical protein